LFTKRPNARSVIVMAAAVALIAIAFVPAQFVAAATSVTTNVNTNPNSQSSMTCASSQTTFGPDYGCANNQNQCFGAANCRAFEWEYENTYYYVQDNVAQLPKPFTGLPRMNPENQKEYVGQMVLNEEYGLSLVSQALPGLVIAILLLLSMILVLFFYLLSTCCKCCGLCRCCFRPAPFTRKALHIAKGIQLVFVLVCFAGCIVIYVKSPELTDGVLTITDGLVNSTTALLNDVGSISTALTGLSGDGAGDVTSGFNDLENAAKTVQKTILDTQDLIEKYVDQIQLGADIVSGVLLGVAFITMVLAVFNFWRLLIIFSVITSIILILSWIIAGVLSAVGVLLEDFCYTAAQYVISPKLVDLSKDIPCPKAEEVVSFGNQFRSMIADVVSEVNINLRDFNKANVPNTNKVDYLCMPYQFQTIADLCGSSSTVSAGSWTTPLWNDEYSNYICENFFKNNLGYTSSNALVYPDWQNLNCGSNGYTNFTAAFDSLLPFKNKISDSNLASKYADVTNWSSTGANFTKNLADLSSLNAVVPTFESILKCDFISDMFASIGPGCYDATYAIQDMWRGFVVVSVGYMCLWITMLVTIGRMSNADLMIDGGKFDAKKAGLI
jgi:hypothetical protein